MRMHCMISAMATLLAILVSGPVSAGDGKVGDADLRDKEQLVIDAAPIVASKDKIAVIVFGGSEAVLRSIYQAAVEYEKTTDKELVFLQAPDRDTDPNSTEFQIFIQGRHTNTLVAVGDRIDDQGKAFDDLKANIEDGIERLKAAQQ